MTGFQLLLQTMDVCDEWLDHVGTGGHAVWANVLSAYAQLHLVQRPQKLRQVTTLTSSHRHCVLSSALEHLYKSWCPPHALHNISLVQNFVWLVRTCLVWSGAPSCTSLLEMHLFTLISKTC